ncbi:MAG: hypothetical protein HPY80_07800 [Bacteroidales bacterium]|jgi:hypothetical protein|nr:hypothetical protein [Bacteroidales bacterium]NPV36557.1 hypothetical protein [Bacteroidales bacterium]
MKNYIWLLAAGLILIAASCQKENDNPQPNPNPQSLNDLVVNSSFDWKTTHQVSLRLTGYANSTCTISHIDGTLIQKVFLKKNETFTVQLNLPDAEKKLRLEYMGQRIELEVTGSEVSYIFN